MRHRTCLGRRVVPVLLPVLLFYGGTASAQPAVESCDATILELEDDTSLTTTINVDDPDVTRIRYAEISIELSHAWIGKVNPIEVRSPEGTRVTLKTDAGGHAMDIDCVFSESGVAPEDLNAVTGTNAPSIFHCGGCRMQTSGGGDTSLADLLGEDPNGDWDLSLEVQRDGELDRWCVLIWDVGPAFEPTCEVNLEDDIATPDIDESEDHVILSFTAGGDYTAIEIRNHGELFAKIIDDFDVGARYDVVVGPLRRPQASRLEIRGRVGDTWSLATSCELTLLADPVACATPLDEDVALEIDVPYTDVAEFDIDTEIVDLSVDVDISYRSPGDLEVTLTSPSDTTVTLFADVSVGGADDLFVTFWDFGVLPGSVRYDQGHLVQPSGPGTLADFSGERTIADGDGDDWVIRVNGVQEPGTVHDWGVCVYDRVPGLAPTDLACAPGEELGSVRCTAVAAADYTRVRWFVNGELASDTDFAPPLVAGDELSYTTDALPLPSYALIEVQGFVGEETEQTPGPFTECSLPVTVPEPRNLACIPEATTAELSLTWSLPDSLPGGYDSYELFVDGELLETIADGSATEYTTDEGYDEHSTHQFMIVGVLDAAPVSSIGVQCRGVVVGPVDIEECVLEAIPPTLEESTSTVTVVDVGTVENVEVFMDGNTAFLAVLSMTLDHVDTGSTLSLRVSGGSRWKSRFCVLWTNGGAGNLRLCEPLSPDGPGDFSVFSRETSDGEWSLTLDPQGDHEFELETWCLYLDICEVLAPTDLAGEVGLDNSVELSWVNAAGPAYDEVRVYRDGDLHLTLEAEAEQTTIDDGEIGRFEYTVAAYSEELDCEGATRPLEVMVGVLEECTEESLDLAPEIAGVDCADVLVFDPFVLDDIEVAVEMDVTFARDWSISLVSPIGTRVQLHLEQGNQESFDLVWSNRNSSTPRANGTPFDCDGCVMKPSPGTLRDFRGEISDGVWTLEAAASGSVRVATLDRLCLTLYSGCAAAPPSDVFGDEDGKDVVVTWLNNADLLEYDSLEVERDGEILADDLDPTDTLYLDESPAPGVYTYRVIAVVTDPGTDEQCRAGSSPSNLVARGVDDWCFADEEAVGGGVNTEHVVNVGEELPLEEVQVVIDIAVGFRPQLRIVITNPNEESVTLYRGRSAGNNIDSDMDVVFADGGASQPVFDYNDGGLIAPSGPGELADFGESPITGDWTLSVIASGGSAAGTLREFCVRFLVSCGLSRPAIDSCLSAQGDGHPPVELVFSGIDASVVDEIQVLRNGVVIATLDSDATEYVDEDSAPSGRRRYQVAAYDVELDCVSTSFPCLSDPVHRVTACAEPDLDIAGDRVEMSDELEFEYVDEDGEPLDLGEDADRTIHSVEVGIELSTTFTGSFDISLLSPDLTAVQLHNNRGGHTDGLQVTWSDDAPGPISALPPRDPLCECLVLPSGPGTLTDLWGRDPEGPWVLSLNSFDTGGTLERWCLTIAYGPDPTGCPGPRFVRGDVDDNGWVSPLVDGLRLLFWGMAQADEPPCRAAADVDGNGVVSALPDALRLFGWAMAMLDPPPAPFPDCGCHPDDPYLSETEPCDTDADGASDGSSGCAGDPGE